ncbi:unnamed protein product [Diatraea saccharalis]|nr:unnamed protein product [Diatraea saccharalis]
MFFNGTKARAKFQHNIKNKAFIDNIYKTVDRVVEMHSPRYIKTHLPLSLLPPDLLDTCKVVYTALEWTPCFDNVKESWEKRNHPNMLFIFYEESLKDLASTVDRVVKFFGKTITDEQRSRVCVHLSFENFKKNKSVNKNIFKELDLLNKDASFVRKGKAGTWRELFDEEMTRQAEQWMADNLRDTDLRYPTV